MSTLNGRLGPRPVWTGAQNLAPPPGFDPRIVQPVASVYTDWAILFHGVSGSILHLHVNVDSLQSVFWTVQPRSASLRFPLTGGASVALTLLFQRKKLLYNFQPYAMIHCGRYREMRLACSNEHTQAYFWSYQCGGWKRRRGCVEINESELHPFSGATAQCGLGQPHSGGFLDHTQWHTR